MLKTILPLVKNGRNNAAVTFPMTIVRAFDLKVGDAVEVEFFPDERMIVLRPVGLQQRQYKPVVPVIKTAQQRRKVR